MLLDVNSPKGRTNFSVILQQGGTDWKLGDLYIEPAAIGAHDSDWFAARARGKVSTSFWATGRGRGQGQLASRMVGRARVA